MINNPFILYGYESEEYFCDRKDETSQLLRLIENGNNVALIAPRRIGKTGLIENLYHLSKVRKKYYTFLIDIYATKNMEDMVMAISPRQSLSVACTCLQQAVCSRPSKGCLKRDSSHQPLVSMKFMTSSSLCG